MKPKILYVDDNVDKLSFFKENLPCFEVVSFSNPFEALENLPDLELDAFVLDICMPFMDGFQFYEKLLSGSLCHQKPVFFLSETHDQKLLVDALQKGAREVIHFPPRMSWDVIKARINNKLIKSFEFEDKLKELQFDPILHNVKLCQKELSLTKTEFDILNLLSKSKTCSVESMMDLIWDGAVAQSKSNLPTHIYNLNKKILDVGLKVKRKGENLLITEC